MPNMIPLHLTLTFTWRFLFKLRFYSVHELWNDKHLQTMNISHESFVLFLSELWKMIYKRYSNCISRFIVVCKPLQARSICTIKRTRLVIIFVCLFGLTFNLTRFLELKHVWFQVPIEAKEGPISEYWVKID